MQNYSKGFLITLAGVLILSPDSLLIRLVQQDVFTIIFYRGLLASFWMIIFIAFTYKKKFFIAVVNIDKLDLLVAFLFSIGSYSFVIAISYTTIAKALLIISISPIISAVLSRIFLAEKILLGTLLTIVFTIFGFVVIFYEAGSASGSFLGNISAVVSAFVLSSIFVISRYKKKTTMIPLFYSGIFVAIFTLFFSPILQISAITLYIFLASGLIITSSFLLLTLGAKYIPATEVSLLMLLETVLSIVFAWIFLQEIPALRVIIGGIIIIAALGFNSLWQIKKN